MIATESQRRLQRCVVWEYPPGPYSGPSLADLRLPAFVSQSPGAPDFAGVVAGVLHAVHHRHLGEVERADAFQLFHKACLRDADSVDHFAARSSTSQRRNFELVLMLLQAVTGQDCLLPQTDDGSPSEAEC